MYHHPKLALADMIMELEFFVSGLTCSNMLETDPKKLHGKSVKGPYWNIRPLMKKLGDGQVLSCSLMNPSSKSFAALALLRLSRL